MRTKRAHANEKRGIGLYSYEQEKNTTPFQYFAQIVVGVVVFLCGAGWLVRIFYNRAQETLRFGSPEPHWRGFISSGAMILIGIGMGHAGVIFWGRRLRGYLKDRHTHRHHRA
jgi:hypothetical protein